MTTSTLPTIRALNSLNISRAGPFQGQLLYDRGTEEAQPFIELSDVLSTRQVVIPDALGGGSPATVTFWIGPHANNDGTLVLYAPFDPNDLLDFAGAQVLARAVIGIGQCMLEQLGLAERAVHLVHQGIFVAHINPE